MKNTKRALRRHHKNRLLIRAKAIIKLTFRFDIDDNWINYRAVRLCDNMKNCSCSMCCSPRSKGSFEKGKWKLTMQERKADEDFNYQLTHYNTENN